MKPTTLIALCAVMASWPVLAADPPVPPSLLFQGYQRPDVKPVKPGYVTKDGERHGNCKVPKHRGHQHCKERVDPPKSEDAKGR